MKSVCVAMGVVTHTRVDRPAGIGSMIDVLNDVPVAVERALYWKAGGVGFAGGTNATAVRVP